MRSMKMLKIGTLLVVVLLAFTGCQQKSGKRAKGKQSSTGKTSEMLVVMNEAHWKSVPGDTVRAFFGQTVAGLPQGEPCFTMANVPLHVIKNTKLFKTHRNLFIVEFDPKAKEVFLETRKNLWSQPQTVIKIVAPNHSAFVSFFGTHQEAFMEAYHRSELERIQKAFAGAQNTKLMTKLREEYQLSMLIPEGFFVAHETPQKDFIWIRRNISKKKEDIEQAILVYLKDYSDTIAFQPENIIKFRNSFVEKHVHGSLDNSYVTTTTIFPPQFERINFNGKFAVETRGLWETKGDFMGGPFVQYTLVDESRNRFIGLEGFVYHPSKDKRDLLMQMEAIIKTFKAVPIKK